MAETIHTSSPAVNGAPTMPDFDIPAITLSDDTNVRASALAGKSLEELRPMLLAALSSVEDKEKDLIMAAEIGRNLVAANEQLKRKYDSLLRHSRRSSRSSFTLRMDKEFAAASSLSTSTPTTPYQTSTSDPTAHGTPTPGDSGENLAPPSSAADLITTSDEEDNPATPLGDKRPGRGVSPASVARHEHDMLRHLERQNADLHARLDASQADLEHSQKAMARRVRKLDADLSSSRRELDRATDRCAELEAEVKSLRSPPGTPNGALGLGRLRSRASMRSFSGGYDGAKPGDLSDDTLTPEEALALKRRCADLEAAHTALAATKRIVNDRLAHTQSELRASKLKSADLESRVRALDHLEAAYDQQATRIDHLERALEEQRRLACGEGPLSPAGPRSRSPDLSPEGLVRQERKIQDEYDRGMTLMDELEMVLFNANQLNDSAVGVDTLFKHSMGESPRPDGSSIGTGPSFTAGLTGAGGFILDELVSTVGASISSDLTQHAPGGELYPHKEDRSFFGLARALCSMVYRWVRFMCVLWAAVVLTVARGPRDRIKQH